MARAVGKFSGLDMVAGIAYGAGSEGYSVRVPQPGPEGLEGFGGDGHGYLRSSCL